MRDEKTAAIIRQKSIEIMQRIQQGRLFGEPIDPLNPEELLLAAYLIGWEAHAAEVAPVYDITAKLL